MKYKELSVALFLETIVGIHRKFHLASKRTKVLICGRIIFDCCFYTIFIACYMLRIHNSSGIWAVIILGFNIAIHISTSLLAIYYSKVFLELTRNLYKLHHHYKESNDFTVTDAVRIALFMVIILLTLYSNFVTLAFRIRTITAFITLDIIYHWLNLVKNTIEYNMYVILVSTIGRLIESLNLSINHVTNKITSAKGSLRAFNLIENDIERWSTHYRLLVACSNLVNTCFGKQVRLLSFYHYQPALGPCGGL
jgi:hypothetical protein